MLYSRHSKPRRRHSRTLALRTRSISPVLRGGAFQLEEEAKLRDQFIDNLRKFGGDQAPTASANDLALLDRQLNEVYQRIMHSPTSKWEYGTVKPEGIRDTERKWLALVSAWMAFARTAYPQLAEARIKAQLFRLRLQQLRALQDN